MERRKKRIVKLTAFLFLLAASIFVMPQKAFADENEDVTLPTGDIIAIPENNAKNSALQNVNYCVTDFRRTPVRLQIRSL